jgi:hypothetical protein
VAILSFFLLCVFLGVPGVLRGTFFLVPGARAFLRQLPLDFFSLLKHKEVAAVAATRGDLGQLAPRKKLLKSF